jgi:NDP-sugar pyrophosphorylase family protein
MKTIILAAGQGKRLRPLTENKPKPMVEVANKPILKYILESISKFTNDVIIITKYKEEQIKNYFKNKWKNINIEYKTQSDAK